MPLVSDLALKKVLVFLGQVFEGFVGLRVLSRQRAAIEDVLLALEAIFMAESIGLEFEVLLRNANERVANSETWSEEGLSVMMHREGRFHT